MARQKGAPPQGGAFFVCEVVTIRCQGHLVERPEATVVSFERSARRDLRWWLMGLVGVAFLWASLVVEPEDNCSEGGECAPWLVPVAGVMGALALAGAIGSLLANSRRGSRLDFSAGTLDWWQGLTDRQPGDHGSIPLSEISRISIRPRDDNSDLVSLYDRQGERLPFFDSEVIGISPVDWARNLVRHVPAITLDLHD